VSETVQVVGNHIGTIDDAYFLIIDGEKVWGFERDPTHDPPVHSHGFEHKRLAAGPIPFKKVLELALHGFLLLGGRVAFGPPTSA
jgi:hypothetical protein